MSVFDNIRTWITFVPDQPCVIEFEDDEPIKSKLDAYENTQHIFEVNGDELVGISSQALLRTMKPFAPLAGKSLVITRTGVGKDTRYTVEELI